MSVDLSDNKINESSNMNNDNTNIREDIMRKSDEPHVIKIFRKKT